MKPMNKFLISWGASFARIVSPLEIQLSFTLKLTHFGFGAGWRAELFFLWLLIEAFFISLFSIVGDISWFRKIRIKRPKLSDLPKYSSLPTSPFPSSTLGRCSFEAKEEGEGSYKKYILGSENPPRKYIIYVEITKKTCVLSWEEGEAEKAMPMKKRNKPTILRRIIAHTRLFKFTLKKSETNGFTGTGTVSQWDTQYVRLLEIRALRVELKISWSANAASWWLPDSRRNLDLSPNHNLSNSIFLQPGSIANQMREYKPTTG